ncbi:MAG: ABC transporter substrate-binding protein [Hyphomonadaceae bacterium]|nr:ABC transporter substrate-binding protein [Hyphomonadaceae bacterium]
MAAGLALCCASAAAEDLQSLARDAEGDTLALIVHGVEGHEATVREFQRRYPKLDVQVLVQNPSTMAPRIIIEQQNGIYAWDSWWAGTAALEHMVRPAGGFAPITDYVVLPDILDPGTWRAPAYRYTSQEPYVFVHSMSVEETLFFNTDVVKGLQIRRAQDLLDPRLEGRIAIRDPTAGSAAHNGTYTVAELVREEGPDFVRRLLVDQRAALIENNRQLTDGALRGDYAVVIGGNSEILAQCQNWGGCRSVERLPFGTPVSTRGVAVMRNPPHPKAVKLWINWLLSREGQEVYVREWAKDQSAGASSMRRDVAPDPQQARFDPDYDHLERYGLYGMEVGKEELARTLRLVEEVKRGMPRHAPASTLVVLILALALVIFMLVRAFTRGAMRPQSPALAGSAPDR